MNAGDWRLHLADVASEVDGADRLAELASLLREVLRSPTNHKGVRWDKQLDAAPKRYEAKRLNVDLLDRIRLAVGK